ncbi:helix-turn-helix domain-containing protein [Salmonella enterica]|nr:helix-turn-helix domain-containing protein [Salmonella enterica]EHJ6279194.1 helix-turn-helix domain-containing protein [Salmonella enterica subsp. enterica serovar 4,[5],12:i:-]
MGSVKFDVKEYSKITYQILIDISRVWYYRKIITAKLLFDDGFSIDAIADKFNVSHSKASDYINKFNELMKSSDSEAQYKFFVALQTPDKMASPEIMDSIVEYVYQLEIYKEKWFFKLAEKSN